MSMNFTDDFISNVKPALDRFEGGSGGDLDAFLDGSMTDIVSNVETIRERAFYYYSTINSVSLPKIQTAPKNAFAYSSVVSVDLPELRIIEDNAFYFCTSLVNICVPNVTEIGTSSFYSCAKLKSVDLTNISKIATGAFSECTSLAAVIIRNMEICNIPSIYAFPSIIRSDTGTGYVYVPAALVEDYKAATNWSTFADKIRAIEDYPEITGGAV